MNYAIKDGIYGKEIKLLRKKYGLSREELSEAFNISKRTIEKWETSNELIHGPIVLLLKALKDHPDYLEELKIPKMEFPLRLMYMEDRQINTIIDVNIIEKRVKIKNYTNNIIARAFGNKENITYEDYERFLESRCFPKTRDKIKIQLDLLGLSYYDPLMIIEKTQGKMADDNYYIEIIRGNK